MHVEIEGDETMTFCDQISDETKDMMRKLVGYTKETGNEHGMKLCKIDDKIINSKMCVGDKCSISADTLVKIYCPPGSEFIADFHTHPGYDAFPSPEDIEDTLSKGHRHGCISASEIPSEVYCYTIPDSIAKLNDDVDTAEKELSQAVDHFYDVIDVEDSKSERASKHAAVKIKHRDRQSAIVALRRGADTFAYYLDFYMHDNATPHACKISLMQS